MKKLTIPILITLLFIFSCNNKKNTKFLSKYNFDKDEWFLVHDYINIDNEIKIIYDRKILNKIKNNLIILNNTCMYTTCGNIFRLYKNGIEVDSKRYIDSNEILINKINKFFIKASKNEIEFDNKKLFFNRLRILNKRKDVYIIQNKYISKFDGNFETNCMLIHSGNIELIENNLYNILNKMYEREEYKLDINLLYYDPEKDFTELIIKFECNYSFYKKFKNRSQMENIGLKILTIKNYEKNKYYITYYEW